MKLMENDELLLRPLKNEDAQDFFDLRLSDNNNYFLDQKPFRNLNQALKTIKNYNFDIKKELVLYYGIILRESNTLIGTISLFNFNYVSKSVEIGFEINYLYQRKGYMNQAFKFVLDYATKDLLFCEIYAHTRLDNLPALSLLQKYHFTKTKEMIIDNLQLQELVYIDDNNIKDIKTKEATLYDGLNYGWLEFFNKQKNINYYSKLEFQIISSYNYQNVAPKLEQVYNAFKLCPLNDVKVVIIGQDPYHTPGVADGLAFSSQLSKIPPSLKNIFIKINEEYNINNTSPSLTKWAKQGVLLLNTILSVEEGLAKSHHKFNYAPLIKAVLEELDNPNMIVILWGNDAKKLAVYLKKAHIISGAHPSPLAQGRFFEDDYFKKVNDILLTNNKIPIDWST